jgi:hypothetical protein
MSTINVKRGIQFKPELFHRPDRTAWLDAVGAQLKKKGLSVTVGAAHDTKVVKNAKDLKAALAELERAASASGSTVQAYVDDLLQALDDVVKGDAKSKAGDNFDLRRGSDLSKALGLHDGNQTNYASMSTTEFGRAARTRPEATMAVGGVTLQVTDPPPPIDLTGVPHISTESLRNASPSWGREGEEVEDTRVITGLTKEETVALANTALTDIQRPRAAAGLTVGRVPMDEISWESDAHELRRANPYVSFTLDNRSFEVNPNTGQPRVGIGRDFFFDVFMAKKDLRSGNLTKDLQKADLMYRGRIRYGSDRNPLQGTRVLIGMKAGTTIDADGTKHARKVDARTDSPSQQIFDSLVRTTQTGKMGVEWGLGNDSVAPPAAEMHRIAIQKGITDNLGGENNVLALEPGAVARQIRGRFHLNETPQAQLREAFAQAGEPVLKELKAALEKAPDWAPSGSTPSKAELLAQAGALLDRSAIVSAAAEGLKAIDPNVAVDRALIDRLWPTANVGTRTDAKLQRVVADTIRKQYDAFAAGIERAQRQLAGNEDRAVRNAGSASDVVEFLRQKAAVARIRADAGGAAASPAACAALAKQVADLPDGRDKTDRLQALGVGVRQLQAMTEASFTSPATVSAALSKKQSLSGFLAAFDAQLAGPSKDAFATELAAFLATKNNPALQAAADKDKVLGDLRKNLMGANLGVMQRMVEGAGGWAQAIWFNNYRTRMIGVDAQSWNFIIGSMDYTEFYKAEAGLALPFADRVKRGPLDPTKMTGAMLSNDFQIELAAEQGYTSAVARAQLQVNGAAAGLIMAYARSKPMADLPAVDAKSVEQWFLKKAGLPKPQREAWVDELAQFAVSKGSPVDLQATFAPLLAQEKTIAFLMDFAKRKDPTLNTDDRQAIAGWYSGKVNSSSPDQSQFFTEMAQYAAEVRADVVISEEALRALDAIPFTEANASASLDTQRESVENLRVAQEVWSMVKAAQRDLSAVRGQEVQRVLRDNNLQGKGWDPPEKPKGDYGLDFAIP